MKLQEFFTDESKWTKRTPWRNDKNKIVNHISEATKFCLIAAIDICYPNPEDRMRISDELRDYLKSSISGWNDDPARTFQDIRQLIEEKDL